MNANTFSSLLDTIIENVLLACDDKKTARVAKRRLKMNTEIKAAKVHESTGGRTRDLDRLHRFPGLEINVKVASYH